MDNTREKCVVVRSRYGTGTTTYLQGLTQDYDPKKVLLLPIVRH